YLLIDEYDNFANEILMHARPTGRAWHESLLRGVEPLKTIFKTVKAAAAGSGLDRVFITGVASSAFSELTGGYNVAESLSLNPFYHELCGFIAADVKAALDAVVTECNLSARDTDTAFTDLRQFCHGYRFTELSETQLYNPALVFSFLKRYQAAGTVQYHSLVNELALERNLLGVLVQLPGGKKLLVEATSNAPDVVASRLDMPYQAVDSLLAEQPREFIASLLYHYGLLTLSGQRGLFADFPLQIPNASMLKLFADQARLSLFSLAGA
ncbi:MAG: AAA family ATPase, partial [Acidobacteria bacterium]|nr:AAA family ATPase [Acidobacteriota bacterium]